MELERQVQDLRHRGRRCRHYLTQACPGRCSHQGVSSRACWPAGCQTQWATQEMSRCHGSCRGWVGTVKTLLPLVVTPRLIHRLRQPLVSLVGGRLYSASLAKGRHRCARRRAAAGPARGAAAQAVSLVNLPYCFCVFLERVTNIFLLVWSNRYVLS